MQYIKPNYQSWCMLSVVDKLLINVTYVNNAFCAIDKFDEQYIYLLLNNDGTQSFMNYLEYLQNLKCYVDITIPDIDLILVQFKVDKKHFVNYNKIVNGDFDKIPKAFNDLVTSFVANCVRTLPQGFHYMLRILFLIIDNSEQLITDYWDLLLMMNVLLSKLPVVVNTFLK